MCLPFVDAFGSLTTLFFCIKLLFDHELLLTLLMKRTICAARPNSCLLTLQDGEAYAYLLNVLAPELCSPSTLDTKDPTERAKLVLEHAEKMGCKRYLTPKDIVEGSTNLNLAFVAQIFHERYKILQLP